MLIYVILYTPYEDRCSYEIVRAFYSQKEAKEYIRKNHRAFKYSENGDLYTRPYCASRLKIRKCELSGAIQNIGDENEINKTK